MPPIQNQGAPTGYGAYPQNQPQLPKQGSGLKLLPITIILGFLLFVSLLFGLWAFSGLQDYKTNSDEKAAEAVKAAEQVQAKKLEAEFAEREKSPLKTYQGPADYGSVKIMYPKVWSAYVEEAGDGDASVNGYFHPNFVPGIESETPIAIRMQVNSTNYTESIKEYEDQVASGELTARPFVAEQVKNVKGMRFDGQLEEGKRGAVIVLPLRDKTLKIWTENPANLGDLNNIVLKNLTFSP